MDQQTPYFANKSNWVPDINSKMDSFYLDNSSDKDSLINNEFFFPAKNNDMMLVCITNDANSKVFFSPTRYNQAWDLHMI